MSVSAKAGAPLRIRAWVGGRAPGRSSIAQSVSCKSEEWLPLFTRTFIYEFTNFIGQITTMTFKHIWSCSQFKQKKPRCFHDAPRRGHLQRGQDAEQWRGEGARLPRMNSHQTTSSRTWMHLKSTFKNMFLLASFEHLIWKGTRLRGISSRKHIANTLSYPQMAKKFKLDAPSACKLAEAPVGAAVRRVLRRCHTHVRLCMRNGTSLRFREYASIPVCNYMCPVRTASEEEDPRACQE